MKTTAQYVQEDIEHMLSNIEKCQKEISCNIHTLRNLTSKYLGYLDYVEREGLVDGRNSSEETKQKIS